MTLSMELENPSQIKTREFFFIVFKHSVVGVTPTSHIFKLETSNFLFKYRYSFNIPQVPKLARYIFLN